MIRPMQRKGFSRLRHRNGSILPTIWRKVALSVLVSLLGLAFLGIDVPRGRAQGGNAYDLIAVVNQLRTSNGLAPYQINAALMASAQAHSDYQASIGSITHTGAGGTRPKDRAVAAGYGGGATVYVSENIAGGMTMDTQGAVQMWQADSLHLNTMLEANYVDVGAGVATSGNMTYFTLDAGYVAGAAGSSGSSGSAAASGSSNLPAASTIAAYSPVLVSTPKPDGSVVHEVQPGQSLWSIAANYKIALPDLLALNGFTSNTYIYPGDKILIKPSEIAPSSVVSVTASLETQPVVLADKLATRPPFPTVRTSAEALDRFKADTLTPLPAPAAASHLDPLLLIIGVLVFGGTTLIILGNVLKRGG
jgi:LysM repeat protein